MMLSHLKKLFALTRGRLPLSPASQFLEKVKAQHTFDMQTSQSRATPPLSGPHTPRDKIPLPSSSQDQVPGH